MTRARARAVCLLTLILSTAAPAEPARAQAAAEGGLFDRPNLVAWCIVPFDGKKRGPEERAAMLERLGIRRFAYDWRAEHLPHFEEELAALKKHGIELTAVWFPTILDNDARFILDTLARHKVRTQLWVTGGGGPTPTPGEYQARVGAEVDRLRPIAEAAAKAGCTVGLYNHGGWFGEPENQLAVMKALDRPNVGLVYNLHHGHEHLSRFSELLRVMKPHLLALNLNGMTSGGEKAGEKIVVIGQGDRDLDLLRDIRDSGWRGPVGILNHTGEDAETRLKANLQGLERLAEQLRKIR